MAAMQELWDIGARVFSVGVGVLMSFGIVSVTTRNPSRVPMRRIFPHALTSLLCLWACWWVLLALGFFLIAAIPWVKPSIAQYPQRILAPVVFGLVIPQMPRLLEVFPFEKARPALRSAVLFMAYLHRRTVSLIAQEVLLAERSEFDRLRSKHGFELAEAAIHRLYEVHARSIKESAEGDKYQLNREDSSGLQWVHHRAVKLNRLLLYFGCLHLEADIADFAKDPDTLFPKWPLVVDGRTDRRVREHDRRHQCKLVPKEERVRGCGRRWYDSPTN